MYHLCTTRKAQEEKKEKNNKRKTISRNGILKSRKEKRFLF